MKPTAYLFTHRDGRTRWVDLYKECDRNEECSIKPLYEIDFTKYKLVPIEPTAHQIEKGMLAITNDNSKQANEPARHGLLAYKAMIDAYPKIEDI